MCGIVGIASKKGITTAELSCFKQMLFADTLRGADGTGIVKYDVVHNKLGIDKLPVDASTFMRVFGEVEPGVNILIGHNRKATVGKHSYTNTHPFSRGSLCGVHNGTFTKFGTYDSFKDSACVTDSEQFYNILSKNRENVVGLLENLTGEFALTWLDTEYGMLYFARNSARPLAMYRTANGIVWSSEEKMLEWITDRVGIKLLQKIEVAPGKILEFDAADPSVNPNVVDFDFSLSEQRLWEGYYDWSGIPANRMLTPNRSTNTHPEVGEIIEFKVLSRTGNEVRGQLSEFPYTTVMVHDLPKNRFAELSGKPLKQVVFRKEVSQGFVKLHVKAKRIKVVKEDMQKYVRGPDEIYIQKEEFYELVKSGCFSCGDAVLVEEAEEIAWTNGPIPHPICVHCAKELTP